MNIKQIIGIVFLLFAGAGLVFAVARRAPVPASDGKIEVVASFYPLAFFAAEIGGDYATVTNITPAGAEPHEYEPTAGDIARMERSRILILNGAGLEPWGERIRGTLDPIKTRVVIADNGLATMDISGGDQPISDPHMWLSPLLAQGITDNILAGLIAADPLRRAGYEANAAALKTKLVDLDREYRESLRNCGGKNIITSHTAFGYLAAEYGLHQIGIAGVSPDAEPSVGDLARIAEFAKKNRAEAIFFESLTSPRLSETIAREIGARVLPLNPIEGLTGEEIARGENYFTIMRSNLNNLHRGLVCTP